MESNAERSESLKSFPNNVDKNIGLAAALDDAWSDSRLVSAPHTVPESSHGLEPPARKVAERSRTDEPRTDRKEPERNARKAPTEQDKRNSEALMEVVQSNAGVLIDDRQNLFRNEQALRNTRNILFDKNADRGQRVRAAAVLAANGQTALLAPDGTEYIIKRDNNDTTIRQRRPDGGETILHGIVDHKANLLQLTPQPGNTETDRRPQLNSHSLNTFGTATPAREANIDSDKIVSRDVVSNKVVSDQFQSEKNGPDRSTADKSAQGKIGDSVPDKIADKVQSNVANPQQMQLEKSRAVLIMLVSDKIPGAARQNDFLSYMATFEKRAQNGGLTNLEVSKTYDQLGRLLNANNGKIPEQDRILAAESFALHMADPKTVDQGQHNTCNVTTIAKRNMFRNPSLMAELVATACITGTWTAPDGKRIELDAGTMLPGAEEMWLPPTEPDRTYATQIMDVVLANDVLQRRMPPEFYYQAPLCGIGKETGERVKYADGSIIKLYAPGIYVTELGEEGTRLNKDKDFLIVHKSTTDQPPLVHISTVDELKNVLVKQKNANQLPLIIQVDVNDTLFDGVGDDKKSGLWHVLLIDDFDSATGQVHVLNQWGRWQDKSVAIDDLYRSTVKRVAPPSTVPVPPVLTATVA